METQTRKVTGPPPFIAAVVTALLPAVRRAEISGDLHETYVSLGQYLRRAARGIFVEVVEQVRLTFDMRFVAGEACVFVISFAGAPLVPLAIVIAAAIGVLILRDAYLDPKRRSQQDAAAHGIVASTFAFLSQVVLGLAEPSLTLPYGLMIRGGAISLMMMSAWRLVFFLTMRSEGPGRPRRAGESYRATSRMNILWIIACGVLISTNSQAVPETVPWRDFWFAFIPLFVFALAYRLQINPLDRTAGMRGPLRLSPDSNKEELRAERDLLWKPGRVGNSRVPWNAYLELLFFVLLALPEFSAAWRWFTGDPSLALVDWFYVGMNFGALVPLAVLWIFIKKVNQKTAQNLQDEMDALNRENKK